MTTGIETGTSQRLPLSEKIDAKFDVDSNSDFSISGGIYSDGREVIYLDVPIGALRYIADDEDGSEALRGKLPSNPQDFATIELARGSFGNIVQVLIPPINLDRSSIWRAEFSENGDQKLTTTHNGIALVEYKIDPKTIDGLGIIIDAAKRRELSPEEKSAEMISGYNDMVGGSWTVEEHDRNKESIFAATSHHGLKLRKSGRLELEHPIGVAKKLWKLGIRDSDMQNAAINHDLPEDADDLKQPEIDQEKKVAPMSARDWREIQRYMFSELIGERSANIVMLMTRLRPDGLTIFSREKAEEDYLEGFEEALDLEDDLAEDASMLKLTDRDDNFTDLDAMPDANIRNTLYATKLSYLPRLFPIAHRKYPDQAEFIAQGLVRMGRIIAPKVGLDWDKI